MTPRFHFCNWQQALEPAEGKEKERNVETPGIGNFKEEGLRGEEKGTIGK
jgi:hypothetical protein